MTPILECRNLTKRYGNKVALDHIQLSLERGKIIGLLGPNGSGKTTLIKLLNGLLVPTEGHILVNGLKPGVETKKIVSYLPERTYLNSWMKVNDMIEYFSDFYEDFDRSRAFDMLRRSEHQSFRPSPYHVQGYKGKSTVNSGYEPQSQSLLSGRTHCRR